MTPRCYDHNDNMTVAVCFRQNSYDKLLAEVPKYKMITPSVLSDRLRVRLNERLKDLRDVILYDLTLLPSKRHQTGSLCCRHHVVRQETD